jgi:hypothetical protein
MNDMRLLACSLLICPNDTARVFIGKRSILGVIALSLL